MKTLLNIILLAASICYASAQIDPGHQWTVKLEVVDDAGQPVTGAKACVNYLSDQFAGVTDTNGIYTASHVDQSIQLAFHVEKPGYYSYLSQYLLGFNYDAAKWNPTVKVVLNRIINPIPMYARSVQIEVPAVDKPFGFDLIQSDWVTPYGIGIKSDVFFEIHRRWTSRNDFDVTLDVTFPNSRDGLIPVENLPIQGSTGPHIPNIAPPDGYGPQLSHELSNTPANGWKDNGTNQNYYFRVRTVLDRNGNIQSALYGKIYGDFSLDPINSKTSLIVFTYYLNPTANSRNVEFDPNHNLIENLPAMQQIKTP
jgi:hypothetical protein